MADSDYGSKENYRFMQENGIEAFVKYNYFHKEQCPRYTPNPFHAKSLHYNAREDYYVCPMGQHMNRIGTKRDKTASGYITESARYKAKDAKAVLCVVVALKHGEPYYRSQPPVKTIQTAGTGKVALGRRSQA